MKKSIFLFGFLLLTITATFAQKIAYVDTEYILKNIPDYKDAQKKLDDLAAAWQKDIDTKYASYL